MSVEENKALIRRHVELLNNRKLDEAFALFSEDYIEHGLLPGAGGGDREGTRGFFEMQFNAFPDARATVEDMIAEGDRVVVRIVGTGTNMGSFLGMPPTRRRATWSFIAIFRIADGLIAEHWMELNTMSLARQLDMV